MTFKEEMKEIVEGQFTEETGYAILVNGDSEGCATAIQHSEQHDTSAEDVMQGIVKLINDMDETAAEKEGFERGDIIQTLAETLADASIEIALNKSSSFEGFSDSN